MAIKDGKLIGIPLEKTRATCEVAQKINHEIVWERKHPEDYFLEAAVITHTLMCHTCNKIFLRESEQEVRDRAQTMGKTSASTNM